MYGSRQHMYSQSYDYERRPAQNVNMIPQEVLKQSLTTPTGPQNAINMSNFLRYGLTTEGNTSDGSMMANSAAPSIIRQAELERQLAQNPQAQLAHSQAVYELSGNPNVLVDQAGNRIQPNIEMETGDMSQTVSIPAYSGRQSIAEFSVNQTNSRLEADRNLNMDNGKTVNVGSRFARYNISDSNNVANLGPRRSATVDPLTGSVHLRQSFKKAKF